jgi:DNA-binding SARP family transcriptional activator
MLQLRTFGGLTLQQDGENITGVATHRRQLALLALLAVAGDEGMSREKLLAYLWPEKDRNGADPNHRRTKRHDRGLKKSTKTSAPPG